LRGCGDFGRGDEIQGSRNFHSVGTGFAGGGVEVSEFQSFRVSEFQSFRVSEFQSFRVSEFQSLEFGILVSQVRANNARTWVTIR